MGTLFIVATPIGNLDDLSFRALKILLSADIILCEDTRKTSHLLQRYKINKPLLSYHEHNHHRRLPEVISLLSEEKNLALVTDSGTPGISDPGNFLIHELVQQLGSSLSIIPIPGPSAAIALASVSGFDLSRFLFLGFLSRKKGRASAIKQIVDSDVPIIIYESPYRVIKLLRELASLCLPSRQLIVGRELTKIHETIYRGTLFEVLERLNKETIKGECVIIIESAIKR